MVEGTREFHHSRPCHPTRLQRHISRQAKGELKFWLRYTRAVGTVASSRNYSGEEEEEEVPPKDVLSVLVEGRNRRARDFTLTHLAGRVSAVRADQDDASRSRRHHLLDNDYRGPAFAVVRRRNVIEDDVVDEGLKDEPCPGRCVHNDRLRRGRRQVHAK